jgi:hypothetical protein
MASIPRLKEVDEGHGGQSGWNQGGSGGVGTKELTFSGKNLEGK